jgi:hypothetical protein
LAIWLNDIARLERLLDLYTEIAAAGAAAIIGVMGIFRRRDGKQELRPKDKLKLRPPGPGQIDRLQL